MSDLFTRTEEFASSCPVRFLQIDPWLRDAVGLLNEWWAEENERRKRQAECKAADEATMFEVEASDGQTYTVVSLPKRGADEP